MVTTSAGLFFKVAAVPFHQWAPDVYEGAPTPITAYVSVASKTASFALLLRLFLYAFWPVRLDWIKIIAAVAIASLTLGNLAAITQTNVKRMLAYSSISHVGYILLGLVATLSGPDGNQTGLKGIAFYLFVYAFMTIGAFAIIIVLRRQGLIGDELDDLNGLSQRSPFAATLLLIFMLSLAGIPPLAGFVGKYFVFLALLQTGHYYLAVFGALYIVPALYYYFPHRGPRLGCARVLRRRQACVITPGAVHCSGRGRHRHGGCRHLPRADHPPGLLFTLLAPSPIRSLTPPHGLLLALAQPQRPRRGRGVSAVQCHVPPVAQGLPVASLGVRSTPESRRRDPEAFAANLGIAAGSTIKCCLSARWPAGRSPAPWPKGSVILSGVAAPFRRPCPWDARLRSEESLRVHGPSCTRGLSGPLAVGIE